MDANYRKIEPCEPVATERWLEWRANSGKGRRRGLESLLLLPRLLAASDWLGIAGAGFVARACLTDATRLSPLAIIFGATLTANYLWMLRNYHSESFRWVGRQQSMAAVAWVSSILSLSAVLMVLGLQEEIFCAAALFWYVTAFLYLFSTRGIVAWRLTKWRRQGLLTPTVAIVGSAAPSVRLARRLRQSPDTRVIGVFVDGGSSVRTTDVAGDIDTLLTLASSGEIDEVVFASPWEAACPLEVTVAKFVGLQTVLKIDPGLPMQSPVPVAFELLGGVPVLTLQRPRLAGWLAAAKRAEDIAISIALLLLLAPLLALIALVIKLDSAGPVMFRQERYGFNNNRFLIYKFRTMQHETVPDRLVQQATRNDPRVTRIGFFLRRSSLDELPQLFNVLRGEMSLVGPRPHAAAHNKKYAQLIDGYLARHRVKPGLTGLAQVHGARGETESLQQMKRRLDYDLAYIANWSMYLDLEVLLMTVPAVLRGTNAY